MTRFSSYPTFSNPANLIVENPQGKIRRGHYGVLWQYRGPGGKDITENKLESKNRPGLDRDRLWLVCKSRYHQSSGERQYRVGPGAATIHEIKFKGGMTVQKYFNTYNMPRKTDVPPMEVHIMANEAHAGGVGEPGLPPFAPL